MLTWCSNKHPHLKTQIRYVIERLVKRYGYEQMTEVTPEAHQRLLIHLRKQKVRAHNHARVARRQEREERRAMSLGEDAAELEARKERHAEYEALLAEEAEAFDDDDGMDADATTTPGSRGGERTSRGGDGGGGGSGGLRAKAAAAAAAFASRRGGADMAMRQTWMDNSADAADLDLLTAPIVPVGGSGEEGKAQPRRGRSAASTSCEGVGFGEGGGWRRHAIRRRRGS